MDKKKIKITVLGLAFLLPVVIGCTWILKSAQTEQNMQSCEEWPRRDNPDTPLLRCKKSSSRAGRLTGKGRRRRTRQTGLEGGNNK